MVTESLREWTGRDAAPVASASADLRDALPRAMRLSWDFGMTPRNAAIHLLCVEAGRFSLVFQVDHQTLTERGDAYAGFMQKVVGAVAQYFPRARPTMQ